MKRIAVLGFGLVLIVFGAPATASGPDVEAEPPPPTTAPPTTVPAYPPPTSTPAATTTTTTVPQPEGTLPEACLVGVDVVRAQQCVAAWTVSDGTPDAGESFVVSAVGFCGSRPVTVTFNGQSFTRSPDASGTVSFTLVAPDRPGRYSGRISCGGGSSASFFVVVGSGGSGLAPPDPGRGGDELPGVGSEGVSDWAVAGVIAITVGLGLLAVARVRRRDDKALLDPFSSP